MERLFPLSAGVESQEMPFVSAEQAEALAKPGRQSRSDTLFGQQRGQISKTPPFFAGQDQALCDALRHMRLSSVADVPWLCVIAVSVQPGNVPSLPLRIGLRVVRRLDTPDRMNVPIASFVPSEVLRGHLSVLVEADVSVLEMVRYDPDTLRTRYDCPSLDLVGFP